jgi:hypothetical protein
VRADVWTCLQFEGKRGGTLSGRSPVYWPPKLSRGTSWRAGVSGPGHDRSGDLDQDHLDQELDPGIEQVAGVAVSSAFLQPERDVDMRHDAPGLLVIGDGAAAERLGVGEVHSGPDRRIWVVELIAGADDVGFREGVR